LYGKLKHHFLGVYYGREKKSESTATDVTIKMSPRLLSAYVRDPLKIIFCINQIEEIHT